MVLQLDPDSSLLVRATAAAALILHISGGVVGLLSGTAALTFRKGSYWHRVAGNVFFGSMLIMSAIAASVAPLLHQRSNVIAGLFTFYLVATAWWTVRRKTNNASWADVAAFGTATGISIGCVALGLVASRTATGLLDGLPRQPIYVFGLLAALAAVGDLRFVLGRKLSGAQRLTRHVWRMGTALFMAAGSFFLGQQQVFPLRLRGSPILAMPVLAVIVVTIFWILRLRRPTLKFSR